MMPSHLGGDTIIKFRKANVIYIEDFYRNFGYPFADQANGGSINGMVEAIDMMGSLSDDQHRVGPWPRDADSQEGAPPVSRDVDRHPGEGEGARRSGQDT